jgi:hypothetical protein
MPFLREIRDDLRKLPPGPWRAQGDLVHSGKQPVLLVCGPTARAEPLAQVLARLPDHLAILTTATPELLLAQIETLTARIDELERELAALRLLEQNDLGL